MLTNRLVAAQARLRYYSNFSIADQACKLAVPSLAGLLMLWWPAQGLFFLSAALLLSTVPPLWAIHGWLRQSGHNAPLASDVTRAAPTALQPALLGTCALGIILSLSLALYDPHLASYVHAIGQPPLLFSAIVTATAGGALLGALWARTLARQAAPARLRWFGACLFTAAVGLATLVVNVGELSYSTAIPLWLLNGFGYEWLIISSAVLLQNQAPPGRIATLTTTLRSLQLLMIMAAPGLGALLIQHGDRTVPFAAAALCAVPLLILAARQRNA